MYHSLNFREQGVLFAEAKYFCKKAGSIQRAEGKMRIRLPETYTFLPYLH